MAFEKGVVIKMGAGGTDTAWVKTLKSSACKGCSSRESCATGGGGQEQTVEAINKADAKVGDIIQIYMDSASLLKAAFMLYVFPILCMLAGGAAGQIASERLGMDASLLSVVTAFGFFILSMVLVRIRAGRMTLNIEYRPKITRIIGHQKDTNGEIQPPGDCSLNVASSI